MDVFGDDVLFLLDGKTAQDFAGLSGNGSAEDFVLYTKEVMGTKKLLKSPVSLSNPLNELK